MADGAMMHAARTNIGIKIKKSAFGISSSKGSTCSATLACAGFTRLESVAEVQAADGSHLASAAALTSWRRLMRARLGRSEDSLVKVRWRPLRADHREALKQHAAPAQLQQKLWPAPGPSHRRPGPAGAVGWDEIERLAYPAKEPEPA
jgi:hypothetical protein